MPFGEADMRKVRGRRIGMIFQEPMSALDPVFTVGDQITETVRTHFTVSRNARRRSARSKRWRGRHSVAAQLRRRCIR